MVQMHKDDIFQLKSPFQIFFSFRQKVRKQKLSNHNKEERSEGKEDYHQNSRIPACLVGWAILAECMPINAIFHFMYK